MNHFPNDTRTTSFGPAQAMAAVPAVLSGTGDAQRAVPLGVQTHLWLSHSSMIGSALCGAYPRGIFTQWSVQMGTVVNCPRCLNLHADILSDST